MVERDIEIMLKAFPMKYQTEIESIFEHINFRTEYYTEHSFSVLVNGEQLIIPERIYTADIPSGDEQHLSYLQSLILDCYLTRHADGFLRQPRLRKILARGPVEAWVIPYLIRLAGEFVLDIIADIYANIGLIDEQMLRDFIRDNEDLITLTESKIGTYWGLYHGRRYKKAEYPGFLFVRYLRSLRKPRRGDNQ